MKCEQSNQMNMQISAQQVQENSRKQKVKVLQKNKIQKRETKKQMGLVYNSYLRGLNELLDQRRDKREERSLKINCVGQASIIKDLKFLDYQYHPRIKVSKYKQELTEASQVQKQIDNPPIQPVQKKISVDLTQSKQWVQSWDLQQQSQKKVDFIFTFVLLIILLLLLSRQIRQNFYKSYQKIRRLYDV